MRGASATALAALVALGLWRISPVTSEAMNTTLAATPLAVYGVETPGEFPISLLIRNDGDTADQLLGGSTPIAARVAASLSLIFWIGVVVAGRWIGFV